MKYILIALLAIGAGFGLAKLAVTSPDESIPQAREEDINAIQTPEQGQRVPTDMPSAEEEKSPVSAQEIDNTKVAVAFTGYGPGKEHDGSFAVVKSNLKLIGTTVAGSVEVVMDSITTDSGGKLTADVKSKTFFDAASHPSATFSLTNWKAEADGKYTATGRLTMKGVTKLITFPVSFANDTYTADFRLKVSDFGVKNTLMNEEIRLTVTAPLKKI